jgi:hypothetical protein
MLPAFLLTEDIMDALNENMAAERVMEMVAPNEARVNVTYAGSNGDLPDPVSFDAPDAQLRQMVGEAVRTGGVPGIPVSPDADFNDFVIDRFEATEARPYRLLQVRPKTPFGG